MAKAEATVEELVSMIQRGELRLLGNAAPLPVALYASSRLVDSLYRGYPSGAILLWDTESVPLQEFAVSQAVNPYTRLLLERPATPYVAFSRHSR